MSLRRLLRDRRHARLLDAARRGDREAFRTLYREVFPAVTGYLAVRLSAREDVEDLASQVFHRFLEHFDRFDRSRGSVLGWILTMSHHALVDHSRRKRVRTAASIVEAAQGQAPDDPLERLIRGERAGAVRRLLTGMEPKTRQMFELRYEMDMSYREIAELLGISEDSVKQRFSRAHRKLRTALSEENHSSHERTANPPCGG